MRKYRKTFLTQVYKDTQELVLELTLIDSHYKTAYVDSVEGISSLTLVSNDDIGIYIIQPVVKSDKVVQFTVQLPLGEIESMFINTLDKSIQIEY